LVANSLRLNDGEAACSKRRNRIANQRIKAVGKNTTLLIMPRPRNCTLRSILVGECSELIKLPTFRQLQHLISKKMEEIH